MFFIDKGFLSPKPLVRVRILLLLPQEKALISKVFIAFLFFVLLSIFYIFYIFYIKSVVKSVVKIKEKNGMNEKDGDKIEGEY